MPPGVRSASSIILVLATTACSAVTVPPPATPEPSLPDVPAPEPAANSGLARVLIDADVPASVWQSSVVYGYRGPYAARTLACAETPCALTLPYGDHELVLAAIADPERQSMVVAHVHSSTVVENLVLGRRYIPRAQAAAAPALLFGVALLAVGVGLAAKSSSTSGGSPIASPPGVAALLLLGTGLITLGGIVAAEYPTLEQPGARREWSPVPGRIAGGSLGLKF
jgi:hypothetical protein